MGAMAGVVDSKQQIRPSLEHEASQKKLTGSDIQTANHILYFSSDQCCGASEAIAVIDFNEGGHSNANTTSAQFNQLAILSNPSVDAPAARAQPHLRPIRPCAYLAQ